MEVSIDAKHLFEGINKTPIAGSGFLFTAYHDNLIYTGDKQTDLSAWLKSEEAGKLIHEKEESKRTIHLNGKSYYISTLWIKNLDTVLGCIVPQKRLMHRQSCKKWFYRSFTRNYTGDFIHFVFCCHILLRRIRRMLTAVKTIQKGNFDIRIPLYGEDEIDELAQEINIMSAKINELINTVYISENLVKKKASWRLCNPKLIRIFSLIRLKP